MMVTQTAYSFSRQLTLPDKTALENVKETLKREGFGVLTEIDVQKTQREKLEADLRTYDIIGACNPSLAHRVIRGSGSERG